ncbi:MAG: outer membrane lipoprotein chaperone LolA [Desulfurobacteriaceae bacterium]
MVFRLFKFFFLFLIFTTPSYGDNLDCFLENLKFVKTLKIVFSQKTKLPISDDEVESYRGVIYYKRPSKFLWKYTKGSDIFVISDGKFLEVVFPEDRECQLTEVNESSEFFPLFKILDAPSKFYQFFKVSDLGSGEFVLEPRYEKSTFERIYLVVDKSCNLKLFKTVQIDGTESKYVIKSFEENVKLEDNLFKLIPCGN